MGFRDVRAKSERAKIQAVQIRENFNDAADAVKRYGSISPAEFGMDWNRCSLDKVNSKIGIQYTIGGYNGCSDKIANGYVKNNGEGLLIKIDKDANGQTFHDNYIIGSVHGSVDIASKLEIIDDEILPSGFAEPREPRVPGPHIDIYGPGPDFESYRAFAAELVDKSKGIIVSKINEDFGDYVVLETNKDFYIAYNIGYGEAPYIVDNFESLLLDKQTLKKSGEAIWFRRDPRGNWKDRIREFI